VSGHSLAGAAEVAAVARTLARMGFVHAFGHVTCRSPGGVLLTPTSSPLATLDPGDVLELDRAGRLLHGAAARLPLEAPMHLAIYARREDVGAVCRAHAPATAAWACTGTPPPLLHGFGGMVEPVAVWDDPDLIASEQAAAEVAATLGEAPALLLRGNGGLTVGATLDEALVRAWCLEDRCRIALVLGGWQPGRLALVLGGWQPGRLAPGARATRGARARAAWGARARAAWGARARAAWGARARAAWGPPGAAVHRCRAGPAPPLVRGRGCPPRALAPRDVPGVTSGASASARPTAGLS